MTDAAVLTSTNDFDDGEPVAATMITDNAWATLPGSSTKAGVTSKGMTPSPNSIVSKSNNVSNQGEEKTDVAAFVSDNVFREGNGPTSAANAMYIASMNLAAVASAGLAADQGMSTAPTPVTFISDCVLNQGEEENQMTNTTSTATTTTPMFTSGTATSASQPATPADDGGHGLLLTAIPPAGGTRAPQNTPVTIPSSPQTSPRLRALDGGDPSLLDEQHEAMQLVAQALGALYSPRPRGVAYRSEEEAEASTSKILTSVRAVGPDPIMDDSFERMLFKGIDPEYKGKSIVGNNVSIAKNAKLAPHLRSPKRNEGTSSSTATSSNAALRLVHPSERLSATSSSSTGTTEKTAKLAVNSGSPSESISAASSSPARTEKVNLTPHLVSPSQCSPVASTSSTSAKEAKKLAPHLQHPSQCGSATTSTSTTPIRNTNKFLELTPPAASSTTSHSPKSKEDVSNTMGVKSSKEGGGASDVSDKSRKLAKAKDSFMVLQETAAYAKASKLEKGDLKKENEMPKSTGAVVAYSGTQSTGQATTTMPSSSATPLSTTSNAAVSKCTVAQIGLATGKKPAEAALPSAFLDKWASKGKQAQATSSADASKASTMTDATASTAVTKECENLEKATFFNRWPGLEQRDRPGEQSYPSHSPSLLLTFPIVAAIRKVFLTSLPTKSTLSLVAGLVFGGPLENIKMYETMASVKFLHAADCQAYHDATSNGVVYGKDLQQNEKVCWVKRSKDVDVVGGLLSQWIEKGVTRCVRAVPVDESIGMDTLKSLALQKGRSLEGMEVGKTPGGGRFVVWRFAEMADSVAFRGALLRHEDWESCNITYVSDPCALASGVHLA